MEIRDVMKSSNQYGTFNTAHSSLSDVKKELRTRGTSVGMGSPRCLSRSPASLVIEFRSSPQRKGSAPYPSITVPIASTKTCSRYNHPTAAPSRIDNY